MPANRILQHSPLLPACRKVRVMLREKELPFTLEEIEFWKRPLELFKRNPAGEVPILIEEKGTALVGSYAICEYLDESYPTVQFFGNTAEERAEVRRLVEWFDIKFQREVTDYILYEKVFKRLMGYGEPDSATIRAGKKNILHHLGYIAHVLGEKNWLAGEYLTLADITAASHLSCLDYLGDVAWEDHPAVKDWYALIKSRPAFRTLLDDRITGFRPPEHYTNPDF